MKYNPEIHHQSSPRLRPTGRRSIRLKGHDYAGGGEYFITICAHRDWIAAAGGRPFHLPGARELISRVWESVVVGAGFMSAPAEAGFMSAPFMSAPAEAGFMSALDGTHKRSPYAIMPDHFHGLIDLPVGAALGDFVGAFKSRVVHEWIAGVKKGEMPEFPGKIWHRNYYEKIVRSRKERDAIERYIKLNPARLIWKGVHAEAGFDASIQYAAFGNPALLEMKKIGVLASGEISNKIPSLRKGWVWMSGFHSEQEQTVLANTDMPAIRVAAVVPENVGLTDHELRRLADGRLLVICPFEEEHTIRENALKRNRLVADWCNTLWIPSTRKGGSVETMKGEYEHKLVR